MRKIKMFNMVSVDGFFAGADGNIDWHNADDEFNKLGIAFLQTVDTIIFGRVTYELFEQYWPQALADPATSDDDRVIAKAIDEAHKVVFSRSRKTVDWNNSELQPEVDADWVRQLKEQDGKDIVVYGSGTIVRELTNLGLIDEYHFVVNPVVLGSGKALFDSMHKLELLESRQFGSGNILLAYKLATE